MWVLVENFMNLLDLSSEHLPHLDTLALLTLEEEVHLFAHLIWVHNAAQIENHIKISSWVEHWLFSHESLQTSFQEIGAFRFPLGKVVGSSIEPVLNIPTTFSEDSFVNDVLPLLVRHWWLFGFVVVKVLIFVISLRKSLNYVFVVIISSQLLFWRAWYL